MTPTTPRKGAVLLALLTVLCTINAAGAGAGEFSTPAEIRALFATAESEFPDKTARSRENQLPDLDEVISPSEQQALEQERARNRSSLDLGGLQPGVDLRRRDSAVKKQFGKACTAFGLVASLENALDSEGKITLSERHFWSLYGTYSASKAVAAALANRITDEEFWPRNQTQPNAGYLGAAKTQLKSANLMGGKIDEAVKALDRGHSVYIAMRVPADMVACKKVIGPDSRATHGAHALAIVGYQLDTAISGGGYFILKNSWGPGCGDQGYQYLAFHNCERSDMYCKFWEIESVERR